jgi:hypothetical protein
LMGEVKDDEDMERETRTLEKERNIRQWEKGSTCHEKIEV